MSANAAADRDPIANISIDLDALVHYGRIHDVPVDPLSPDPVHGVACDRFGALMARHGLPATVFAVGASLDDPASAAAVGRLAGGGHEIASHSHAHDYRLGLARPAVIAEDLARAKAAIAAVTGGPPVGFRAPGYHLTGALAAVLEAEGYAYDASLLPSAPYLLARAMVLAGMAISGRRSATWAGRPEAILAPRRPYRMAKGAFWREGDGALVELPISVVPLAGVPWIGTVVTTLPWAAVEAAYGRLRNSCWHALELHGIDLLDATDPVPPALAARRPDLRVPVKEKLRRLDLLLERIAGDFEVLRLHEAADRAGPTPSPRASAD